ncbi:MAG: F0F1 ATP synthase subunit epsilon [Dehalococcoidia bacterium]
MPLRLDIVTAEREVLREDGLDAVIAPGSEGQLGILPRHAPLMTMLEPGELRARRGADETVIAISGGFLEVRDDVVTVLADTAEQAEEIDIERAQAARARAEQMLRERPADVNIAAIQAELRRSLSRIRVAQRRGRRGGGPGPRAE